MSLDPAQRAGLERARAIALAREHFHIDPDTATTDAAPFGVVVRAQATAVIVTSSDDLAVLGGVLVWLDRESVDHAHLVCEHHGPLHARRAAMLAPELTVWELAAGAAVEADPAPIADPHPPPADDITAVVAMIERSGAQAVMEDGIMRAEVAGLEVGRVVTGSSGSTLEVGVGRFDREAGALLHSDRPVENTLVATIAQVGHHRTPGAPMHAVNRIGRERWLREMVRLDPSAHQLDSFELAEPIPPRTNLLEAVPAAGIGTVGAESVLVICSVGVDLGLVPAAADLVQRHQPDEVRFLLPARDQLPVLARLAARLPVPASFAAIDPPWNDAVAAGGG